MPVITFSRHFPKGHPKAGQPTHFVEKILKGFMDYKNIGYCPSIHSQYYCELVGDGFITGDMNTFEIKHHTIRIGNRWKVGDTFSPRVWSGKPYASRQIQFAPDIEIKKIWTFEHYGMTTLINDNPINSLTLREIAKNDGLEYEDFISWFAIHPAMKKTGFTGQILCWNQAIEY